MVSNVNVLGPGVLDIVAAERNNTAVVTIHGNLIEGKTVITGSGATRLEGIFVNRTKRIVFMTVDPTANLRYEFRDCMRKDAVITWRRCNLDHGSRRGVSAESIWNGIRKQECTGLLTRGGSRCQKRRSGSCTELHRE
ncbi:hypothetical protein Tco_0992960 [Tanacetum coccineum]|uniref:Pectate lyase n=1 Tax=Tanacetum coccineum TaxID=301880 RepID=A0ABQ5F3K1_9ASTR